MNLWRGKSSLSILYCLLLFIACRRGDDELAGSITPRKDVSSTFFTDTFTLSTSTMLFDSIITNGRYRQLVGEYNDPIFGKITSEAYMRILPTSNFSSFGPNTVLDSIVLQTSYQVNADGINRYVYGSETDTIRIGVYEITSDFEVKSYSSKDFLSASNIPLCTLKIIPNPSSTIAGVPNAGFNTKDDLGFNQLLARARVDNELGQRFIDNVTKFLNNTDFTGMFKGIALKPLPNNNGIIGINYPTLLLYYHNYYAYNNLYINNITGIPVARNRTYTFSNISVDRSTSKLNKLSNNYDEIPSNSINDQCFIQASTGVGAKINFPSIDAFRKSLTSKIIVNRAYLIISPDITQNTNFTHPTYLSAYELGSDGQIARDANGFLQLLQSETSNGIFNNRNTQTSSFTGPNYLTNNLNYKFELTSYIQALIDGRKQNNGLYVFAQNELSLPFGSVSLSSLNRLIFFNNKTSPYNIKLQVYYSPYK
ncbi:MAG: DUF4270 family protein [Bacteroidota bacterium]|nr:DUF4270 family protein [Bacteroidota bacterium]